MIALCVASLFLLLVPFTAAAKQPEPPKDKSREIRNAIEQQLAAFQRDDAEAAFSFTSSRISNLFRTSANFVAMPKSQYRAVYRYRPVTFPSPRPSKATCCNRLGCCAPDNVPVAAVYKMQRQNDGAWKIDGCELARSSSVYAYNTRVSVSAEPSS